MQKQLDNDILKAVCVRYIVNPELCREGVAETEEMCSKTVAKLRWLDKTRPVCVLVADTRNKDPHAVMVRAMGEKIAYLDKSQAPEIRGMLEASPKGMLLTAIDSVNIYKHGYFLLKKPEVREPYTPEDIGVDWSRYQCSEMPLLPDDYFLSHDELSMVIFDELLPDLADADIEMLRQYFSLWLRSVRYNQSREVQEEMKQLIAILSADGREEVRSIAIDIDHLRTKKGTREVAEETAEIWWKHLLQTETVSESFARVIQRCGNDRIQMLSLLDRTEQLMRMMPGELYNDVGDSYQFFSHMNYLAPPLSALKGVLSLLALRTLLCRQLGLGTEPCFHTRAEKITDVRQMPTTIGKVMEFADTQCREYAEVLTVQRLAGFLRDDYEGRRSAQTENMLSRIKPAPNITINTLNGTATGEARQSFAASLPSQQDSKPLASAEDRTELSDNGYAAG